MSNQPPHVTMTYRGTPPDVSDAVALLNRLGVVVDEYGCWGSGSHRVCLRFERGTPVGSVDGQPVPWPDLAATLSARQRKRR
jgi:hypothetical protein